MERLHEQGLRPDWWTFNTLIKMHALQGDKEGAFRAFQAMQAEGKDAANGPETVGNS
jgi:pentatricopeptide repeat protein